MTTPTAPPTITVQPSSTYRLHLTGQSTLHDAATIVDYVHDLGIDWMYASPIQTVPLGATHGYHILDPDEVNPELGGEDGLATLRGALDAHGRGLILDIVPNHLGADPANRWWADLLRHGPGSAHARAFDVDLGDPPGSRKIVLPVLGEPLPEVLAAGQIAVDGGELVLYGDVRLPLAPETDTAAPIEEVLATQHYELHKWTEGQKVLNWRRFFAVNELVGIRVEDPDVFEATHRLIRRLVADDVVQGLRVDHIDGLAAPGAYLRRLRELAGPDRWLLVEKIVEREEVLPEGWPVAGTTGYEVANLLQQWLLDAGGYRRLLQAFEDRTDLRGPVVDALPQSKRHVLRTLFSADVETVRRLIGPISGVPDHEVAEVLAVMASHLAGYRTYVEPADDAPPTASDGHLTVSAQDDRHLQDAIAAATVTHSRAALAVGTALRTDPAALLRWQQLTGPAAAKGFEDRLLYRHVALSSLCEVGADAATLDDPWGPTRVVEALAAIQQRTPGAGATTSTHDTKRSEDVRAVVSALAEVPDAFTGLVDDLDRLAKDGPVSIDAHAGWLLTQSAVALLALDRQAPSALVDRLQAYAGKALREAEVHTSHDDPDTGYEAGVERWVAWLLADEPLELLGRVADLIRLPGLTNALSTTLLKLVGPGVPDIYRGTEVWDDSLVDPDNRRALDYDVLRAALDRSRRALAADDPAGAVAQLRDDWQDGAVKLHVTRTGLELRRRRPQVFASGALSAPDVQGPAAGHVAALVRTGPQGEGAVVGVATRLPHGLAGGSWPIGAVWDDTTVAVPDGQVTDLVTGRTLQVTEGRVSLADVCAVLPVALLECR